MNISSPRNPGCPSVRRPRHAAALIASALVLATVAAGAATGSAAPAAAASASLQKSSGSTLRVESQTSFSTFNPFTAYFDGDLEVINEIYPFLTSLNSHNLPALYLATKWSASADRLTWTFTLRSGLKWSDGKPLTAADAAWTLNLIMHNSVAGTANGALVAGFSTVTAPNPTTLVITTKQPEANLLYLVQQVPIVPEHIWVSQVSHLNAVKNQTTPVVGYGPWILTGYVSNQYATLTLGLRL